MKKRLFAVLLSSMFVLSGTPAYATANVGQNNLTYVCSGQGAWNEAVPASLSPNGSSAYTNSFPASGDCAWYNNHTSNTNILVVDLTSSLNYDWAVGFAAWTWDFKYNPMVSAYNPMATEYSGCCGGNQISRLQFIYYRPANVFDSTLQAACSNPRLGAYQTIYVCERTLYQPGTTQSAQLNGQVLFDFSSNGHLRSGAVWLDSYYHSFNTNPGQVALHAAVHELGHLGGAEHDYEHSFPYPYGCAEDEDDASPSVMSPACSDQTAWPNYGNYMELRTVYWG